MDPILQESLKTISEYQPFMLYLDPGTGGMIISAIVGVFATAAMGLKGVWYKIFGKAKKKDGAESNEKE